MDKDFRELLWDIALTDLKAEQARRGIRPELASAPLIRRPLLVDFTPDPVIGPSALEAMGLKIR